MNEIGAVIPAHNEAINLPQVLDCLQHQNLKPRGVVVIDDGSIDSTMEVATRHPIGPEIVSTPPRKRRFKATEKEFAAIRNVGLERLLEICPRLDYIFFQDADTLIPRNYTERLVSIMRKNPQIAVASGVIKGEEGFLEPRGSGRLVQMNFWRQIGGRFPEKVGWDSYVVLKALQLGYEETVVRDLVMLPLRPTSPKYGYIGAPMRALGYHWLRFLFTLVKNFPYRPREAWRDLQGYLGLPSGEFHEKELRDFVREWSKPKSLRRLQRLTRI